MSFRIEQECPQCGGPLEMEETDRLLRCRFCTVQNFLGNTGPLRFILPRRQPDPYTVYAPYQRFRGTVYSCMHNRIEHRFADISSQGVKLPFLPLSLGLRPQAMKMRFATPAYDGTYLKNSLDFVEVYKKAAKNPSVHDEKILLQAFIGDALNIIYLPLSIKDEEILDGVTETLLAGIPEDAAPFAAAPTDHHAWKPVFLPALCPQCGWNLEGESDSVVLFCANCSSGWQAGGGEFAAVRVKVTPASDRSSLFLPFWNFRVACKGISLASFADFIRATNQALVVKPEWEEMDLCFVLPAFKIRPADFLRLGTQMTLSQRYGLPTDGPVPVGNLHPVTLSHDNAAQGLKVILAHSAVSKNTLFPLLPEIHLTVKEFFLHYLPFGRTSHELRQTNLGVTINQRVLNYGRSL